MTWRPGLTVKVNWDVYPYLDWGPGYYPKGGNNPGGVNDDNYRIIQQYYEHNTAIIPLPPPPPKYGTNLSNTTNLTVHFLACNQLFVDYGTVEEEHRVKLMFDLLRKSQKLCSRRPVVKSMADYHKYKARMDAVKKEYASIPQIILPEYIQELKNSGQWPTTDNSKGK